MVYRDWLCSLSPEVSAYVHHLCYKRRTEMREQMIALYETAQEIGKADFVAALQLAAEQQMYGVEYIRAIVAPPQASAAHLPSSALPLLAPAQEQVERDLSHYEQFVANRDNVAEVRA